MGVLLVAVALGLFSDSSVIRISSVVVLAAYLPLLAYRVVQTTRRARDDSLKIDLDVTDDKLTAEATERAKSPLYLWWQRGNFLLFGLLGLFALGAAGIFVARMIGDGVTFSRILGMGALLFLASAMVRLVVLWVRIERKL
jgi:hypothetical protein